ncbi:uncharacterized protein KD926_003661 [Aspergillus affinis]|uniref:uncharacterized protein n=1 Tax=Aspergillus affinis TaxID=1070780 RepID=UPI0022FDE962|nr:uncharacterized protein KD926_003661 [Aspergillus affinis]KAI9043510.1 hypothetical protein KD926_003661 [Aspergillus affinis]
MLEGLPSLSDSLYLLNAVKFHSYHMLFLFDEDEFVPHLHELYERGIEKAKEIPLGGHRTPPGAAFFERAMSLMPDFLGLHRHPNLGMQVLYLTGFYLISVDMKDGAYAYIGQALRMCIIEGLYRDSPDDFFGIKFANQCRNIWWTMYILERQISAMIGAPCSVQDAEVTCSLPVAYDNSEMARVLTMHAKFILNSVYTADIRRRRTFISTVQLVIRDMAYILRDLDYLFTNTAHPSLRTVSTMSSHLYLRYHQNVLPPLPEVYQILCTLSRSECRHFLSVLTAALNLFSTEATTSQDEKLLHQPLRSDIVNKNKDTTLFMPCSDTNNTGIKIITLPAKQGTAGVNLVFSPTGQMLGLVGASQITAFRTALATMYLFVRVSHIPKRRIKVRRKRLDELEKGVLSGLRPVNENVAFRLIAKEDTPDYEGVLQEELGASDAIFCCTPSTEPLFSFSALKKSPKSRFISLIGSYKPHMMEIDTETLLSGGGKVFVDTKEACLEESGELIDANLTEKDLIEIGEHLGNGGSVYPEGNVVLKCVGMGLMDLVSSRLALDLTGKKGLGQEVHGF